MSHSSKFRSSSPGSRRLVDPLRASTGTVAVASSTDVYKSPASYYAYDGYPSAKIAERASDHRSSYDPRRAADRKLEVQPISSTTYRDPGQSTKVRTEYTIRPRPRSGTSTVDSNRRPLSVVIPSSTNRQSPVITSAYEGPPSSLPPRSSHAREDPERYITPASSAGKHHQRRIYSSEYGSDTGRLDPADRARVHRDRDRRYRVYRHGGRSGYRAYGDPRKWDDSDYYDAYSYTNPREQFEKDSALRSSQRSTYRIGRPLSITGAESLYSQNPHKQDSRSQGPFPSQRGFERGGEEDRIRRASHTHVDSDVSRDSLGSRAASKPRPPVSLHQDREDEYNSYTDDHRESRRHRRHHRDHGDSRKHTADGLLAPIVGGLATLGLASGYEDKLDTDRSPRNDRRRSRGPDRGRDRDSEFESRDYRDAATRDKSRGPTTEGEDEHRRHRRRRERSTRRDHSDSDASSSTDEDGRKRRHERPSRKPHDSGGSDDSYDHRYREHDEKAINSRRTDALDHGSRRPHEDGIGDRSRKPVTVDPAASKEPEAPPKSILKPPREKFPEDETHIREGVAPLKDAQKKGIPTGARWTKIDRRLVNPAALTEGHERFEERPEYVIVLRVLSKEEIQAYAVKTQEIRDARHQAARQERRRLREERRRNGQVETSSSDDEDEDEVAAPLAIEAPPERDDFPVSRPKQRVGNEPVTGPARVE